MIHPAARKIAVCVGRCLSSIGRYTALMIAITGCLGFLILLAIYLPSQLGTIVGIVIGTGMIVYQLDRQHTDSIKLQSRNHKEELKVTIHEQICEDVRTAMEKQKALHLLIGDVMRQYINCACSKEFKKKTSLRLYTTVSDVHTADRDAISSITRLMSRLEECEIIDKHMKIFRFAFASVVQYTSEAYEHFLEPIFPYLPCDIPEERQRQLGVNLAQTESPTLKDLPAIEEGYHHYLVALVECLSFISDLSRELQNVLLGDLFENTVAPRKPGAPNVVVVTTKPEDVPSLTAYFTQKDNEGRTQHQKDLALRVKLMKDNAGAL